MTEWSVFGELVWFIGALALGYLVLAGPVEHIAEFVQYYKEV